MNTETTNSVNNNFDINTVQLGTKFVRLHDKAKGELVNEKGKNIIRFQHPKTLTFHTVPFSDKWQLDGVIDTPAKGDTPHTPVQDVQAGENLLDSIIEQTEKKKDAKTSKTPAKDKIQPKTPVFESLTDAELERRKELEKEYKSLDSKEKKAIEIGRAHV